MKRFLLIFLLVAIMFPYVAESKEIRFNKPVSYQQGESQTPEDALTAAKTKAKRQALDEAGVYIESLTVVKNSALEKDEIIAISFGTLKEKECKHKYVGEYILEVSCDISIDTDDMEKRIADHQEKKSKVKEVQEKLSKAEGDAQSKYDDLVKIRKELEKEISARQALRTSNDFLVDQLSKANLRERNYLENIEEYKKADKGQLGKSEKLKKQYRDESRKLEAENSYYEGLRTILTDNSSAPKTAIKYFSDAIEKKPDFAEAYVARAFVYFNLVLIDAAIRDYNTAIQIDPKIADAYYLRGMIHYRMDEPTNAIAAYDKAIQLDPNNVNYYIYRGFAYEEKNQYSNAIQDYNEAILRQPDLKGAYILRGQAYFYLGNRELGCRSIVMGAGFSNKAEFSRELKKCTNSAWH